MLSLIVATTGVEIPTLETALQTSTHRLGVLLAVAAARPGEYSGFGALGNCFGPEEASSLSMAFTRIASFA